MNSIAYHISYITLEPVQKSLQDINQDKQQKGGTEETTSWENWKSYHNTTSDGRKDKIHQVCIWKWGQDFVVY